MDEDQISPRRALCLAAGMLTDVPDPLERIRITAEAGYDGLGLRIDEAWSPATDLHAVRAEIDARGLLLLDIEMVMLTDNGRHDALARHAIDAARALRPRHLVTVCFDNDRARSVERLQQLVEQLEGSGVRPVLEFLPFSSVKTLADARALIVETEVGDRAAVLVDVLHLIRAGGSPADIAAIPPDELPYLQVCDAQTGSGRMTRSEMFREALSERLLPGEGTLPVRESITAFPAGCPLSVEVLSDALMREVGPLERARMALDATRAML